MLKSSFLNRVRSRISADSRYELADFDIIVKPGGGSPILTITYLGEPSYRIEFVFSSSNGTISCKWSPSDIIMESRMTLKDADDVMSAIIRWQNSVWEELMSHPVARMQEKKQKQIDELLKNFNFDSQEYFTQEEANEWKSKLTKIELQVSDMLKQHIQNKEDLDDEIKELKKDIETLKSTVDSLKKGYWGKTLVVKAFTWFSKSENRQLAESGYEMVKGLLASGEPS